MTSLSGRSGSVEFNCDQFVVLRNGPKGKIPNVSYIQNSVSTLSLADSIQRRDSTGLSWCVRAHTPGGLLVHREPQWYPIFSVTTRFEARESMWLSHLYRRVVLRGGYKFHTLRELFFSVIIEINLKF